MRTTRSKTSATQAFANWPTTKRILRSTLATPCVRSRTHENHGSDSESHEDSDLSGDSDGEDVIVVTSLKAERRARSRDVTMGDEMIENDSKAGSIFKRILPTEAHQLIISFLPRDQDVLNYMLVCKSAAYSVTDSVWRERSSRTFDAVEGRNLREVTLKYKFRQDLSRQWTCFDLGKFGGAIDRATRQNQMIQAQHCVQMLKDLILESNGTRVLNDDGTSAVRGLNLQYICDLISGRNGKSHIDILDAVLMSGFDTRYMEQSGCGGLLFAHKTSTADHQTLMLYTVQVCLASLSLHPDFSNVKIGHFDLSQYTVYALATVCPIFHGDHKEVVNVPWLLQAINFFKYHLKADGEGLLAHAYEDLPKDQLPQLWIGKIRQGTMPLGKHWKGIHTYMDNDDLGQLRMLHNANSRNEVYPDTLDGGEAFSDISIFFDKQRYGSADWPQSWENILHSKTYRFLSSSKRRRSSRNSMIADKEPEIKHFWGSSRGMRNAHFFGAIHSVEEQHGFYGFQRIVLMKFYTMLSDTNEEIYDPTQVWAYEGCVLPGGNLIVGRWWDANDTTNNFRASGPYIWWNVARSGAEIPIEPEEAFNFLNTFQA